MFCLHVFLVYHTSVVPTESGEDTSTGVTDGCEILCGCRGWNLPCGRAAQLSSPLPEYILVIYLVYVWVCARYVPHVVRVRGTFVGLGSLPARVGPGDQIQVAKPGRLLLTEATHGSWF